MWKCIPNGKIYIGQSINLKARQSAFLNFNDYQYGGDYINNARKKYNKKEYWEYKVLCYCHPNRLDNREKWYIELFHSFNKDIGYNLTSGGTNGYKMSDETRMKLLFHSLTNNGMKGTHHTKECKQKISHLLKAYYQEHKPHSCKKTVQLDMDGNLIKIWDSAFDAEKTLGIRHIHECCNKHRYSSKGFKWIYYNEYINKKRECLN